MNLFDQSLIIDDHHDNSPVVPTVIMSNPPTLIGVIVKTILLSPSLVLLKDDTDRYLVKTWLVKKKRRKEISFLCKHVLHARVAYSCRRGGEDKRDIHREKERTILFSLLVVQKKKTYRDFLLSGNRKKERERETERNGRIFFFIAFGE